MPAKKLEKGQRLKQSFGYKADPVHKRKADKIAEKKGTTLSKMISDFVTGLAKEKV